jgi:glycerol-3-phosphate dehydrogenase
VTCYNRLTKTQQIIHAKALVNATGPWTEQFLTNHCKMESPLAIRLVKGSHIVLPKLYPENDAYMLQNKDGRVVFVIPFQKDFTMIGTTDVPYEEDPAKVHIDDAEKQYLCAIYNEYFSQSISPSQILYDWSGVRPLYDDHHENPAEVTRDYKLDLQTVASTHDKEICPILSVFGGKITTYRHLSKQAFDLLKPFFNAVKKYDSHADCLPGGMIPNQDLQAFVDIIQTLYPYFHRSLLERYAELYGSRLLMILENKHSATDLGPHYGHNLYKAEVQYLKKYEWAHTTEDILWRRTKLGLYFSAAERQELDRALISSV